MMEAGKTKKKKKNPSQRKDMPKVAQAKALKKKQDKDRAEKKRKVCQRRHGIMAETY
jgi:hypothetical protein